MSGVSVVTKFVQGAAGVNGTNAPPTGTGFVHITAGAQDSAARAVNLASADVGGTLPVANGGTGLTAVGGANAVLTSTGSAMTWASTIATSVLPTITISGDATGSGSGGAIAVTVTKLRGNAVASGVPTAGYVLTWSGSQWAGEAASVGIDQLTGDVIAGPGSGSQSATVVGLRGFAVAATGPTDTYVLTWSADDDEWIPAPSSGGGGSASLFGDVVSGTLSGATSTQVEEISGFDGVVFVNCVTVEWVADSPALTTTNASPFTITSAGDLDFVSNNDMTLNVGGDLHFNQAGGVDWDALPVFTTTNNPNRYVNMNFSGVTYQVLLYRSS